MINRTTTINPFHEKDLTGLCDLMTHWGKDYSFSVKEIKNSISHILTMSDNKILIAKKDNEIVGYAQISKCYHLGFEPFIEVVQLLVSGPNRSLGIGALLMKYIEDEAKMEHINIVKLHSQVHRSKSHVFYENLGYNFYKTSKFYEKRLK